MRIVTHYINEKFSEQSDPVNDMGIGLRDYLKREYKKMVLRGDVWSLYDSIFRPIYGIKYRRYATYLVRIFIHTLRKIIENRYSSQISFEKTCKEEIGKDKLETSDIEKIREIVAELLNSKYYLEIDSKYKKAHKKVNEKFTEEGDPLADMNIGQNFYKEKITKLFPLRFGSHGVDYIALVKYILFEPETTVEESKDYMGRTMYTVRCSPREADPFYNYLASLVTHKGSNVYITKQIGKRGKSEGLVIVMDDVQKPAPVNEKFSEESDPVRDLGIGAKFVYYRLYKSDQHFYTMYIYGDSYNVRDILKKYNFKWDDQNYAWKSRFSLPKELWEKSAPKMFEEIEKVGGHTVQLKGKITDFEKDMERSFAIPGYEHWEYPPIPDGNGAKVYFKQWHHHAPIIGVLGKGSYLGKAALRYDGYQYSHGSHMWERTYNKEDVDDLIKYFESRGYKIIDGRKAVRESLYEKFTETNTDPVKDLGIGGFSFDNELRMLLNKFNPEKKAIPFDKLLGRKDVQKYWQERLNAWFLGRSATGIFAKGNSDSYGSFHKQTTGKIIRVETMFEWEPADAYSLGPLNFALVVFQKGAWFVDLAAEVRNYINADEVWYWYMPKEIYDAKLSVMEKIYVSGINEKFIEKSDPIKDMGIGSVDIMKEVRGMYNYNDADTVSDETFERIKKFLHSFLNREIEGNFKKGFFEEEGHYRFIPDKIVTYFGASRVAFKDKFGTQYEVIPGEKYFTSAINEKFVEDGDPIHQMGIGIENVREFDTLEEAAKTFVDNINVLSHGAFKSKEDLRQYIKDWEQGVAVSGRSLLKTCKDYMDGHGKYPYLYIKDMNELYGDGKVGIQKLQILKNFKDAVVDAAKTRLIREKLTNL